MDFLDPKKKRAHKRRLYIGYALMAVVIVASTLVIGFMSFGFNVDPKTGDVVQNGLLFVDAHPESARVIVNGKDRGQTDTRLVIPAGKYNLELQREGYRTWKQNFELEGGTIERFIYPFLFPQNLLTEDAQLFATTPTLATQSPDRKWLLAQHSTDVNSFELTDLSTETLEAKPLVLPNTILTQPGSKHIVEEVEWSTDNRHVLLKHSFDTGTEFILVDREDATRAVNLNALFVRPISAVRLRDKKYDQFYLYDAATSNLVSATLANKEITQIASKVLAFQPHGSDKMVYISDDATDTQKVRVMLRDGDKAYFLRDITNDKKYLLDMARFDGKWYVAVGASVDQRVFVYTDPLGELAQNSQRQPVPSVLLRLNAPIDYLSFSANTRFISVQAGSNFAVFDAENSRQIRYDTKLALPAGYEAKWMDGHRFAVVSEGKVVVFDFNGTNMQTLVAASPAFRPFFDRDYNNMLVVGPSVLVKDKTALTQTAMRIKPN